MTTQSASPSETPEVLNQQYMDLLDQVKDDPKDEWTALINSDFELPVVETETHLQAGDILNQGSGEVPTPMQVSDLAFRGYVPVWDTITGVQSLQPRWLIWQTMLKKRPDGSQVFQLTDPHIPPRYGEDLCCYLNPDSEEFDRLNSRGFPQCRKRHIPNQMALDSHVRHSHKNAWAFLEQDRRAREREEDRAMQRDLLAAMSAAAMRGVASPEITEAHKPEDKLVACDACNKTFYGVSIRQAGSRLILHQRHCKPYQVLSHS